jgi:hypothetical protein
VDEVGEQIRPQGRKVLEKERQVWEIPLFAPFIKGDDRGRSPSGCATMSGSFRTGPPRDADQGGKGGFGLFHRKGNMNRNLLSDLLNQWNLELKA